MAAVSTKFRNLKFSYRQCCCCIPHGETLIFILAVTQGLSLIWTAISSLMQVGHDKVFVATSGNATIDAAETVINTVLIAESGQITTLSAMQLSCGILLTIVAIVGIVIVMQQKASRLVYSSYCAVFAIIGAYFAIILVLRMIFLNQQRNDIIKSCIATDAPAGAFPACLSFIPFKVTFIVDLLASGIRALLALYFGLFMILSAMASDAGGPFSKVEEDQQKPPKRSSSFGHRPHRRTRSMSIVNMPLPENEEVGDWSRRDSVQGQEVDEKVAGLNMDENDFVSYSTRHQRFVNDKTGEFVNVNL